MSLLLNIDGLEKTIGNRVLFSGLTFSLHERERVGLIGPNGAGKSTLLKIMAGLVDADGGEISVRKGTRLVYLPQVETLDPTQSVLAAAVAASANDVGDEHEKEARAAVLLGRIGFTDMTQPVGDLSGGWLKRLSIARQLAREPDLLLLDEPTNHLDMAGIEWLEDFLRTAPFAYLLVTHDRMFLERATNRMIEISPTYPDGVLSFNCAYAEFVRRRDDYVQAEQARHASLANKSRREQEWVKAGVKARGTKQRSRVQQAAVLADEVDQLQRRTAAEPVVKLDFTATERKTKRLIVAHNVGKSFGGSPLFEGLDLTLSPGMRLALLGDNGTGKTTLMRLLAGEETPDSGTLTVAAGCKIIHFDQRRQLLDENATVRDTLGNGSDTVVYRDKPIHVSGWARKLKFRGDQLDSPVKNLSGGERARLIMGRLMLQTADVLLLDEPTNDLDIPAIEILEESLQSFPGALVLVTHDRALLSRVATHILALEGEGRTTMYATLEQWQEARRPATKETAPVPSSTPVIMADKAPAKAVTKLSYNEQREWDLMEQNILTAEARLADLQAHPVTAEDAAAFADYCNALADASGEVERLYARWSELEAKLAAIAESRA